MPSRPDPQTHAFARGRHIPELDGVRALAIAAVIVFHCRTVADSHLLAERAYYQLASAGWIGVDLFFVLSGFLITGILLDTAQSANYFQAFYTRRILRIFPLYYATLTLVTLATHLLHAPRLQPTSPIAEVAHWLFLQNWLGLIHETWTRPLDHFWSLGVEEQFYFVWPALVWLTARRRLTVELSLATIALAIILRIVFAEMGWAEAGNFATVTRMDTLAVGAYLACIVREQGLAALRPRPLLTLLVCAGAVVVGVGVYGGTFFRPQNPAIYHVAYFPLALFFGGVVAFALCAERDGGFRRLLRSRPLTALGKISYGVYIVHWPIAIALQDVWRGLHLNFWVAELTFLAVVSAVAMTVASISFRYFESPFLRLKDRVAPQRAHVLVPGS